MDIQHLTSFIEIANSKSFTKTAEKLGYVQSSVSAHINTLEKELGVKLFYRQTGKGVQLTTEGNRVLPLAEQIVSLASQLIKPGISSPETLSIATIESLSRTRLKDLFHAYPATHPNINLVINYGNCTDNLNQLRQGKVDIAIVLAPKIIDPEFSIQVFSQESLSVLVSPEHPLAKKEELTPADFHQLDIILTEKGCSYHDLFIRYIKKNHITPRKIVEINSISAILELIHTCQGVTFLPEISVLNQITANKLHPLKLIGQKTDMFTQIATRKNKTSANAIKLFLNDCSSHSTLE
ncbi:DNA-binding transcriptional regulator, LysR family [Propionispira arboris]|uniref:DNA-binding transcriptional regulator, LysR family n=1 Tax=Propionispira arboris TaxID=84035 RepID=A0A1H7C2Z3_9FIRM|nr:LysR family transcriptional regulator [Propionispira arboris]SEJ84179.1 DNA-binding transcriptional regulator, LysR family [Propionispira arboris]